MNKLISTADKTSEKHSLAWMLLLLLLLLCQLPALVELVTTNVNLETLYLHGTVHEAWTDALTEAWHARGALHRVRNDGQTYLRKVDLAYLRDRTKAQPAWSIRPKKPKKAPKKGKKKK